MQGTFDCHWSYAGHFNMTCWQCLINTYIAFVHLPWLKLCKVLTFVLTLHHEYSCIVVERKGIGVALQGVIKRKEKQSSSFQKKKERKSNIKKTFSDFKIPTLTLSVAQLQQKSFPSMPSVIVSVFRFLCENDGWQVKFVSREWRWTVTEWFVLGMEG